MPYRKPNPWGSVKPPVGTPLDWGNPINNGLLGAWLFAEGGGAQVCDSTGHQDGALMASPAWSVGQLGKSLKFANASSQYVDLGTTGPICTLTGDCTVSLWFRPNGDYTTSQALAICADPTTSNVPFALTLGFTDNKIEWWQSGGGPTLASTRSISTDTWFHVVCTRSGVSGSWALKMYILGALDNSTTSGTDSVAGSAQLCFSRFGGFNSYFLSGWLDNVRVWNRALNPTEALLLYSQPFTGYAAPRRRIISAASGGGPVSVALTGVSGTGAVGSLAPSASIALTGNAGVGAVGSLAASVSIALTGVSATGDVGTLTPTSGVVVALTGNTGTGAVGSLAPSVSIALTGVSATGDVGTLTPVSGVIVALTGVSGTGAVGTLAPSVSTAITGVQAVGTVGTLTIGADATISATPGFIGAFPGRTRAETDEQKYARRVRDGLIKPEPAPEQPAPEQLSVKPDDAAKAAKLRAATARLRQESAALRAQIEAIDARKTKSAKAERDLLHKRQELQLLQAQQAFVDDQSEMMDVAFVAMTVIRYAAGLTSNFTPVT